MKQLVRIAAASAVLFTVATAQAGGLVEAPVGDEGFVASPPSAAKLGELGALRRALREERAALSEEAKGTMGFGDLLITVVAPGGLLYAAHKRARADAAAAEVSRIDEDLALLEEEVRRLADREGLVAELR